MCDNGFHFLAVSEEQGSWWQKVRCFHYSWLQISFFPIFIFFFLLFCLFLDGIFLTLFILCHVSVLPAASTLLIPHLPLISFIVDRSLNSIQTGSQQKRMCWSQCLLHVSKGQDKAQSSVWWMTHASVCNVKLVRGSTPFLFCFKEQTF